MSDKIKDTIQKWTTDKQYPFSGTNMKEKGSLMEIVLNGQIFTTRIDATTGEWSWKPPVELEDGQYSLSFRVIDRAQNIGAPTLVILNVDTTAPAKPDILRIIDNEGNQTGWLTPGAQTDDATPTLSGRAEPNSVVRLYDGNVLLGSAVADSTGGWEITPQTPLAQGPHQFTVTSTDSLGHTSEASDAFTLAIQPDGTVPTPGVATITHADDNNGAVTGGLQSGAITDDTTPTLHGTALAGSTVRIQYSTGDGKWIDGGNATLNGTSWSWTPNPALGEGHWEFRANAGSGWTDEFSLDIDLTPANKVEITHAYDDFGTYTGMLGNGAITDDRTPTLHGRAEANSLVYIHFRNVLGAWELLDSVTAGADGRWVYESDRLLVGSYEFQASSSLNRDVNGKPFGLQIIQPDNYIPEILGVWDDSGMITGLVKSGHGTDDKTPEIRGVAESNSLVIIELENIDNGEKLSYSMVADASGYWAYTTQPLDAGTWKINASNAGSLNKSKDFTLAIMENELVERIYDFESAPLGKITDGWKYDGLTVKLKNSEYTAIEINNTYPGYKDGGKFIYIHTNYQTSGNGAEIHLDKPVNYIEFTAGDWQSTKSYVTFFDINGTPLGKIHSSETRYGYKEQLKFYSESNNISYFKISLIEFYGVSVIDNIITRSNYFLSEDMRETSNTLTLANVEELNVISAFGNEKAVGTLHIEGANQLLNLSSMKNAFKSVEIFDITGSGDNVLRMDAGSLLTHGAKDLFIEDGKTQLMVNGNAGDVVQLADILPQGDDLTGWTQQTGTVTIAGTQYHVYSHGDAELLVQDGVKTELV